MVEKMGFNPDTQDNAEIMQQNIEDVLRRHLDKLGPGREYAKDPELVAKMIEELKGHKDFLRELNEAVQEVEAVQ